MVRSRQLVRISFEELSQSAAGPNIDNDATSKKVAVCVAILGMVTSRYFEFEAALLDCLSFPAMMEVRERHCEIVGRLADLDEIITTQPSLQLLRAVIGEIQDSTLQHFEWIDGFFCVEGTR